MLTKKNTGFNKLKILLLILSVVVVGLFSWTRYMVGQLEGMYPPAGKFVQVPGRKLHVMDVPASNGSEQIPALFIHGASGNLLDQMHAFPPCLGGSARRDLGLMSTSKP